MKKRLTSLTVLFIFALGCSPHARVSSQNKKPQPRATPAESSATPPADAVNSPLAQAMKGLRDKLLTSSAEEVLSGEDAKANVWGALMEFTFPDVAATFTVVSLRDGTASLYISTGGGMIGGYIARKEAKRFVTEAEKHVARMKPAKSFPYPGAGRMTFYVLTRGGVYTGEGDEKELLSAQHALFPLFLAANEVLTVLRTQMERANPDEHR